MQQFQISKCWQTDAFEIVFQCRFYNKDSSKFDKCFLVLNLTQNHFGVRLLYSKPNANYVSGNFVEIIRKEIGTKIINGVYTDVTNQDIWIQISSNYFFHMKKSTPPEIVFIKSDEETEPLILMKWGMGGTFTKRRSFGADLPNFEDDKFEIVNLSEFDESAKLVNDPISSPEELTSIQKDVIKKLRRKLKTVKKSYNSLNSQIPEKKFIEELEEQASLLKSFTYLVKPRDEKLSLPKEEYGFDKDIVISLDPGLSVGQNMEKIFKKLKRAKKGFELGEKRLTILGQEILAIENSIEYIRCNDSISEVVLKELLNRHQIKHVRVESSGSLVVKDASPYRTFYTSNKKPIFVGKGAGENDLLTKGSKSNDFWFHAVGVTGSHVVVPFQKEFKDGLPQEVIKEACILAIHFSKLKADMKGEVYFTKKQFLKKAKGMPKGLWQILHSETLYVSYVEHELEVILNRY